MGFVLVRNYGIPAVLLTTPSPELFHQTIEIVTEGDELVCENVSHALSFLFTAKHTTRNLVRRGRLQELAGTLTGLISSGKHCFLEVLASLAESLEGDRQSLWTLVPILLRVGSEIRTTDAIRCAAAVARVFPGEVSSDACSFANAAMEIISDDVHTLAITVTAFTSAMGEEQLNLFVRELLDLMRIIPDIALWPVTRLIAKQMGKSFGRHLALVVRSLVHRISENTSLDILCHNRNRKSESFNISEICRACEALADYAEATGEGFDTFLDYTVSVARRVARESVDENIKMRCLSVFKSLAVAIPDRAFNIAPQLLGCCLLEQRPSVRAHILSLLEDIFQIDGSGTGVRDRFLRFAHDVITSIIRETREDTFDDTNSDHYLHIVWSSLAIIRHLYPVMTMNVNGTMRDISTMLAEGVVRGGNTLIAQLTEAMIR